MTKSVKAVIAVAVMAAGVWILSTLSNPFWIVAGMTITLLATLWVLDVPERDEFHSHARRVRK